MAHPSISALWTGSLPRLNAAHLQRPRLSKALLEADCHLRLLCAPAGSGKSALLSECLQQCPSDTLCAHLNLRGQSLGCDGFVMQLATALCAPSNDLKGIRQQLKQPLQPMWLVLDDYPHLPDTTLDELLNELIQSSSPRIYWWLASRRRPALPLTRLLLEGDLFELGRTELSFNEQELNELLRLNGQSWFHQEVADLLSRSQGWCSGVRLHLLRHASSPMPYDQTDPRLLEYLRYEVLDELPDSWKEALYTLAQFPVFDQPFCEQLFGIGIGAQRLEQLKTCGLFIEPAEQQQTMYRVQTSLATVLASQLPKEKATLIFSQACQWYIAQNNVRMALRSALKAEQPDIAADLLQRLTGDAVLQGRSLAQVIEWRGELNEDLLTSTPRLLLLNAWALMLCGRLDEAQDYADQLSRFLPQPDACNQRELIAQWKALTGNLAFHSGAADRARELLGEAIEELSERAWSQRLFSCALRHEQALIEGRLDDAQALNRAAIKQARQHGSLAIESVMALGHVKLLEIRGELLRAETLLKHLYTELTQAWGNEPSPMRGRVQLRRAALLLQQGRYQEAENAFIAGQEECRQCDDHATLWGYLGLAELDALKGDFNSAFLRIAEAERLMQYHHINEAMYQGLVVWAKARIWLTQGRFVQVERAVSALPDSIIHFSPYGTPELHLRLALVQLQARLANGAVEEAMAHLNKLHSRILREGRRTLACEVGLSLAEALLENNKPTQARHMLLDSLAMARQIGLASVERAFVQRNPTLICWSEELNGADSVTSELLSRRELDVLKLIAQGHSNQQIAELLFISLHTVKTHAQRVNFKLGVKRRTHAVVRAKALGLT